ncbi:glycosyltransferase family 17-domain-containing protein [Neohortaea acidophila]|uniref:Glycosyltransferase family 17-domain-containing protein n=1 Tax=Neohortaea acidophila TaxID=245834 RepID=A0A6A6Q7B0_9PEZI|nr:glycosyltransferase family 17-domain-containing protein [Neohortaea acidophila]KAF2488182.1 glycosyltransferase family 17-domain-containing protein [Neohortaea acidophila]
MLRRIERLGLVGVIVLLLTFGLSHGFSPFAPPRKVFDLVLFSTELDWLEIRLHTHAPYVDYFVIVESPTTFTNRPKPLHLKENWARYKQFHHQIIYRVVEDPIVSARHWDHEDYLRNALLHEVFPSLEGSQQEAQKHDVLIVSDMDELLRPDALLLVRHCAIPKRLTLRSHFYYYSFQWLHRGEQWAHPQASTFGVSVENTLPPNDLRQNLLGPGLPLFAAWSRWWESANLWNAGWHCSSCFASIQEVHTKMDSFSHQLWNTPANRDVKTMVQRVRSGMDLFARPDELYDRVTDNKDVPQYVLNASEHEGRFGYLLNRDGEDAGFIDWAVNSAPKAMR